jgi:hypothetical protein
MGDAAPGGVDGKRDRASRNRPRSNNQANQDERAAVNSIYQFHIRLLTEISISKIEFKPSVQRKQPFCAALDNCMNAINFSKSEAPTMVLACGGESGTMAVA